MLKGLEKADSAIWDVHKMMQTSALCAAVLMKDNTRLQDNFEQDASYLLHEKKHVDFDSYQLYYKMAYKYFDNFVCHYKIQLV